MNCTYVVMRPCGVIHMVCLDLIKTDDSLVLYNENILYIKMKS